MNQPNKIKMEERGRNGLGCESETEFQVELFAVKACIAAFMFDNCFSCPGQHLTVWK